MKLVKFFSKLKHYEIIITVFFSFTLFFILLAFEQWYLAFIILITNFFMYLFWFYSIGYICYYNNFVLNKNTNILYKFFVIILVNIFIDFSTIIFSGTLILSKFYGKHEPNMHYNQGTLFDADYIHLLQNYQYFVMASLIFVIVYLAYNLVKIESDSKVKVRSFLGTFFLFIILFPIGFIELQPRINKIYDKYMQRKNIEIEE